MPARILTESRFLLKKTNRWLATKEHFGMAGDGDHRWPASAVAARTARGVWVSPWTWVARSIRSRGAAGQIDGDPMIMIAAWPDDWLNDQRREVRRRGRR